MESNNDEITTEAQSDERTPTEMVQDSKHRQSDVIDAMVGQADTKGRINLSKVAMDRLANARPDERSYGKLVYTTDGSDEVEETAYLLATSTPKIDVDVETDEGTRRVTISV